MNDAVPSWLLERPVAHRGLHDRALPENSLAAFEAAASNGYPVELDVRVSADGVAVVFHDRDLERLTGQRGPVERCTHKMLQELRLEGSAESIPVLSDVLEALDGRVGLLVEVKNEGMVGRVEMAAEAALARYAGPVAVQSFNPHTLRWFAEHAPERPRGLLSGDFADSGLDEATRESLRNLALFDMAQPAFIGYDVRCLPFEPVARRRREGLAVLGWTVRSPEEAQAAAAHCDNIIFEGFRP